MSAIPTRLEQLAKLLREVGMNRGQVVRVDCSTCGDSILLRQATDLVAVYKRLNAGRRSVEMTRSQAGHLHVRFAARGVTWTCVVLTKDIPDFASIVNINVAYLEGPDAARIALQSATPSSSGAMILR